MAAPYRRNSMMAMLDAKPDVKGMGNIGNLQDAHNGEQHQFWNDASDNQSPLRKHLISTYLQVTDEEAMPLLGEYFGVALSFVALGALVRASNSSRRKHKKVVASEEERLDLRACSKFERMALESMLKESMERLGNLSLNAYQLEGRVRDLVDENVARDKEKVQLLKRVADAEKLVVELRALRRAEGRANERVMSIVAAKEQDWLKEKRNLQKEIEKLKETVNGMTREAKFQARRCRNPTCEHCKGIDRVVRNVKGRISLRELQSLREASQAPVKRVSSPLPVEVPRVVERQEIEEDRVLMKAIELKKKQRELSKQAGAVIVGASQSASKELLVKQQQDMESELANILKRVGMLKQKSYTGGPSTSKGATEEMPLFMDNNEDVSEQPEDEIASDRNVREDKVEKASFVPEPNVHGHALGEEDSDLVELDNAFDSGDDEETSGTGEVDHLVSYDAAEDVKNRPELEELVENTTRNDGGIPSTTTNEQQSAVDVDEELLALQGSLGDGRVLLEAGSGSNEGLEVAPENVAACGPATVEPADLVEGGTTSSSHVDEADSLKQEHEPEATTNVVHADNGTDDVHWQCDKPSNGSCLDAEGINVAERPITSVENANEDEQVLGVVDEEEDSAEFADASSAPFDPVTCELPEERGPSASFVAEQPKQEHAEYDSGVDVKENWGFEDSVSRTEGELLENQDIPVFERNNVDDDFAGELPEPEEKRVCNPPETLDSSEVQSANELASPVKWTSTTEEVVGSQQEEDPFVEKLGLAAASAKPKSDAVVANSEDHLEPADFVR